MHVLESHLKEQEKAVYLDRGIPFFVFMGRNVVIGWNCKKLYRNNLTISKNKFIKFDTHLYKMRKSWYNILAKQS